MSPVLLTPSPTHHTGDNTDLIQMKEGMQVLHKQLLVLMSVMKDMALKYKDLPTLGFTHYQPAQLTTYVQQRDPCANYGS